MTNIMTVTIVRNFKISAAMLASFLLMGIIGILLSIDSINSDWLEKNQKLLNLVNQVQLLQRSAQEYEEKVAQLDFMDYKNRAFASRYPKYSGILDSIYEKSQKYGFKPDLVLGIVKVESDFDPLASSYRGAYGLMQVNLGVWKDELKIDERRICDVDYNLDTGLKILKKYYNLTRGNMKHALHLYNNGYRYNNVSFTSKVKTAVLSYQPEPHITSSRWSGGLGF